MKFKLIGMAALALVSGAANAQSSVTLYGIIDVGLNYNSNAGGHSNYFMSSGVNNGSRWGLRGSEDLGGGLKAVFDVENGFDVTSGKAVQGGLEFGRQAWVGLASNTWGKVTLGRQYDLVVDYIGPFAVGDQGGGNVAAHPGDIDNLNNNFRVNNAVKYQSPSFGGLKFGALYSLGGVAGSTGRNQIYSAGIHYAYGPLSAGVAYLNARNPNISFFGNASTSTVTAAAANFSTPIFGGYLSASTYQNIAAGAMYKFGKMSVSGTYSNIQFRGLGDLSSGPNPNHYSGEAVFNNAELGMHYHLRPDIELGLAYDYMAGSRVNSNPGATYNQVAASATYALSRRTVVYALATYQHANGTDSKGEPAVAAINLQSASTSNNQTFVRVGLRTKF
ncbi:porin [Burkholderia sp. SG-MS1]|uniref:porin n=1 Tax=Paraburkholderia sp. SG-MS1 TaxID=2023741 RepID=UPI001445C095|nr:porin [Paraburkholderia sp. SG-MS1]NKJ49000.1 porin [Paraburkholderia sp. SG-MS1]